MSREIVERTYTVHTVGDYNSLVSLVKEMGGCVLRLHTQSPTGEMNDADNIRITVCGEESFLDFAYYLFKKYTAQVKSLNLSL